MKRVLFALFLVVISLNLTVAGTPMTDQGTKALSFAINGLGTFGVGSLTGSSLYAGGTGPYYLIGAGGKYYLSKDMELRGVLTFNMNSEQDKDATGANTDKITTTGFGLSPALLWHMPPAGAVSPYWGAMVQFGYAKKTDTPASGTETSGSGTTFGLGAVMGAEWFAWDGVSFNAEYQLTFNTNSQSVVNGAGTTIDKTSYTNFGISSFGVGINVYLGQ